LAALTSAAPTSAAPTSSGKSFSFKAQSYRLSTDAAAAWNKKRLQENPILRHVFEDKDPVIHLNAASGTQSGSISLVDFYQYALIGNVSVGTPAQNFSLMFDIWSSDMSLVDVSATFDTEYCDSNSGCSDETNALDLKNTYNSSASSTASTTSKKFRGSFEPGDKGKITKDTVTIGGVTTNIQFGDLTQVGYYLDLLPIDGTVGISAVKSTNKIDNVLNQLVSSLSSPVFTLHVNRSLVDGSIWPNTDAEIAFGTKSLPQCNSANWATISLIKPPLAGLGVANATSVTIASPGVDGPCNNAVVQTSHPIMVVDFFVMTQVSVQAMEVFKKASGATYNTTWGWYTIDCTQLDTLPSVVIGLDDGNNITLTARDYTLDLMSSYGACFLFVRGTYDEGDLGNQRSPILLGQNWLNRHCVSYDISANTLSYTDAVPNNGQ